MALKPKAKILLVDDQQANLVALESLLSDLGQELIKASSGAEALKRVLEDDFAVILLDIQMQNLDGFETAQIIRGRDRSRNTPIIFLTAFESTQFSIEKAYSLGAVDYLTKPIIPTILRSKVSVFVELFQKTAEIKHQAETIAAIERTARERAEGALEQSELRKGAILDAAPDCIVTVDARGRILEHNWAAERIFGIASDALRKSRLTDLLGASIVVDGIERSVLELLTGRDHTVLGRQVEIWGIRGDGSRFPAELALVPLGEGSTRSITAHIRDITERKKLLESERSARQEAQTANRQKDEFLATLSHELRTPLNAILGWIQVINLKKVKPERIPEGLAIIERNARLQARIVDDLLDMNRIVAGKLLLDLQKVSVDSIIDSACSTVRHSAELKKVSLLRSRPAGPGSHVSADPSRLQQVLWNLLSNAIKFTPEGGQVDVRCRQEGGEIAIEVVDNGAGIDGEFLPLVFERFRQSDASIARKHGGLGLGLSIAKHITELHRGSISARSEGLGCGAVFEVRLPLVEELGAGVDSENAPSTNPSKGAALESLDSDILKDVKVLIVDDERDARELVRETLEQYNANVTVAGSTEEALRHLESRRHDVLLSDIGMPVRDGYDLIHNVRKMPADQGGMIPAIALTAFAGREDRARALASGYHRHLSKPFHALELVSTVADLAEPSRRRREEL